MYTVKRLDQLDESYKQQAASVLIQSFKEDFAIFNKDERSLSIDIADSFRSEHVYVAMSDEEVIGLAAFSTKHRYSQVSTLIRSVRAFGFLKGYLFAKAIKTKPVPIESDQCYIEDVATSPSHRKKGVAHAVITHLMQHEPYSEFILEVYQINKGAISVYESLGFETYSMGKEKLWFINLSENQRKQYMKRSVRANSL
ncbi:GNAT family N-acetyltransferase [Geomicrobium sediminis]|uniref:Ribosomal protein S18 acetylase RimI-like enzyme n=1 Tax=Geomicrobium sediminis TaxID=1347788 RepID=A0ABS2P9Y1_9BACL|nr:GNAT family N-acetyltransferase [Geomicrobium sediminis]MBM7632112.1 ribosomal protein S18 acetylase RimI-like enzyme [Geomicrobium sediminis]